MAVSLQDNYSCTPGSHTVSSGESVYNVVNKRCSGNRQVAMRDIIELNNGEAIINVGDVLLIPAG